MRAVGDNFIGIPASASIDYAGRYRNIDDAPGSVVLIVARIVNIHLVAGIRADLLGILSADKNAAVGRDIDPELEPQFEIVVI